MRILISDQHLPKDWLFGRRSGRCPLRARQPVWQRSTCLCGTFVNRLGEMFRSGQWGARGGSINIMEPWRTALAPYVSATCECGLAYLGVVGPLQTLEFQGCRLAYRIDGAGPPML